MDEDEVEIAEKKLKNTFSGLKVKDLSIIMVQGEFKNDSETVSFYIQVVED